MDKSKLDHAIATLVAHKAEWATLPLPQKVRMLRQLVDRTVAVADRWVEAAVQAKGIPRGSHLEGEEMLGGPVITVRVMRLLAETLDAVATTGRPPLDERKVRVRPNGQVVVEVFPTNLVDRIAFAGFTGEMWMLPEVTRETLRDTMGVTLRNIDPAGKVSLVLGAGNVSSIGPLDVIHKMFVEGEVVLLKLNPVNDYLGPYIEEAFAPLVDRGFLRLAYGGADVGAYLTQHEQIDDIHITGSDRTHDAIVYGTGEEGAQRKARDEPINTKPITSELGNVSPVIVVPGLWSDGDIRFHAENIATQMTNNAGFNCNATKVIVTHERWEQRERLLDAIRAVLAKLPQRVAYYPGAEERFDTFVGAHPGKAELFGQREGKRLPWALIPGLDPDKQDEVCFTRESFCGVTGEVPLGGADAAEFLQRAVAFCNERLWGTLNATVICHPRTAAFLGEGLEEAIAGLRYGTVALNHWAALSYALGVTAWGAYPGHTRQDIQSGIGFVHNTYLFDKAEKSVVRGPFRVRPKPLWFVTNKAMAKAAPKLLEVERDPKITRLPGLIFAALRG